MDRVCSIFRCCLVHFKRPWPALITLVVAVPGGMLLNELLKVAVQRHRPFLDGPLVDWSGYSFAAAAELQTLAGGNVISAGGLIGMVGFSRIALGAHYLSDVLAA